MTSDHTIPGKAAAGGAPGTSLHLMLDGGWVTGATKELFNLQVAPDECIAVLVAGEPALFIYGDGRHKLP